MELSKRSLPTELLASSKKELEQILSVVSNGGKLISGSGLTIEKIYSVKEGCTNGFLVKNGCQDQVGAIHLLALKELWTLCDNFFSESNIVDTALLISETYPHHRPQELIIAIKGGLSGKYGKTYGKVTTMEVMRWIKEYDLGERAEYFERPKHKESDWRDMDASLLKDVVKPIDAPKPVFKPNPVNEWAQQVMKDFDKEAKPYKDSGKLFIDYKGHKLDIDEYLQLRFNEEKIY